MAEMEGVVRSAMKYYAELDPAGIKFVLVEATNRILPEAGPQMGAYAARELAKRGIDLRLDTRLESCVDGEIVLSDGSRFHAETLVWMAGVKPSPMLDRTGLPRGPRGHLTCRPTLQVVDGDQVLDGMWSAGDCAQVPDLTTPGAFCSPSAQHAVRQARVLADNIRQVILGGAPSEYRHKHVVGVAGLGLYKGVANVYGIKVKGLPAWFMHRTYHMSRIPSFNRKVRVVADWTLAFLLRRETVALGQLHTPRTEFTDVTPSVLDDRTPVGAGAAR
jgi:NADH dehydrogenase